MQTRIKNIGITVLTIATIIGIGYYFNLSSYLSLSALHERAVEMQAVVNEHYFYVVAEYMAIYALLIMLGLPIVAPLSIIGGFLFDTALGTIYAVVAATIGSILCYWIVQKLLYNWLTKRYARRIEIFNKQVHEHGANYLLLLHFMTIVPFFIINGFAALTNIPLRTVTWTSIVGFAPLAFIYAFEGTQLSSITSASDMFSPKIIFALLLLIALACIPIIVKKIVKKYQQSDYEMP